MGEIASALRPLVESFIPGQPPVRFEFWDGSAFGPDDPCTVVRFRSPDAIRRIIWAPNELGLSRAYVAGEIDVDGDIFDLIRLRDLVATRDDRASLDLGWRMRLQLLRIAREIGAFGRPPAPPPEEVRLSGGRHSRARDSQAISHHYDVSNDFYRLVLGETMTYSCAYFSEPGYGLADAQRAKHELVCRKLGLHEGMRLLDVGCGWGEMVIHAARNHGVSAVGVTISRNQADLAAKRVAEAGLADQIEIRLQDYRDVSDGPFDAISSVGMFEHVGLSQLERYFETLYGLLPPHGRLLNHAISRAQPDRPSYDTGSFIGRYVFPDGELHEVGKVVTAMQRIGYEVRDVESLREHYAQTLRAWVANLEANWDEAVKLAGIARARIWRLYMAGSAVGFESGRINVHQVLGAMRSDDGSSGVPPTRHAWIHP